MHNAKERLSFVAAEVREPFPASIRDAGIDTLVMKHFLSGFSDSDADLILKHCKQVLPAQGKILLLQTLVPEAGDRQHNVCRDGVAPGECMDSRPCLVLQSELCFSCLWAPANSVCERLSQCRASTLSAMQGCH